MRCQFDIIGTDNGRHVARCRQCGQVLRFATHDTAMMRAECRAATAHAITTKSISHGPGTELTALLSSVSITEKVGCNCKAVAAEMDRKGVAGCREKREYFLERLNENAGKYSWWEKLKAAPAVLGAGAASLGGL